MLAPLVAAVLLTWPAAESATWVAQLRARLTGVTSVAATYTRTVTSDRGRPGRWDNTLRLARRPNGGEWVGDLVIQPADRRHGPTRYTLWQGKVYEADPAARAVTEYPPHDGDPLRMAADFYQPLLHLLRPDPDRPPLQPRLTGRDAFYQMHTLRTPEVDTLVIGGPLKYVQSAPVTVAVIAVDGYDIPRHLPRTIVATRWQERQQLDVQAVRLDAADGPKPEDIADPTVKPAGWHFVSMAEVWGDVKRRTAEERAKLKPRPQ